MISAIDKERAVSDIRIDRRSIATIDPFLDVISTNVGQETPIEFLFRMIPKLAVAAEVSFALCAWLAKDDPNYVETIALCSNGELAPNIRYQLNGTPCQLVIGKRERCFPSGLQELFPDDRDLVDLGVNSYAGVPLWASDGSPVGHVAVMGDGPIDDPDWVLRTLRLAATRAGPELERHRMAAALVDRETRFRDFADVSSDWFWETDDELRFSWFSKEFEKSTGLPNQALIGKTREEVGAPGADPEAYQGVLDAMQNRKPFKGFHHERRLPDGTTSYLEISGKPAYDAAGVFIGYRGIGRNITSAKQAEFALMKSRDDAHKASRAKSEFLASMSHELRTPLNAIQGMSEALLTLPVLREDTEKLMDYLQSIQMSSQYLTSLIEDVLDLSRIEAGKVEVRIEVFDPVPLVHEAVELLSPIREKFRGRITVADPAGLFAIKADKRLFLQVMLNLIGNSLNHGGTGVRVEVDVEQVGLRLDKTVMISVADNGPGFPPDARKKMGQPFMNLQDATVSNGAKSVGLGLSLVVGFMNLVAGKVEIGNPLDGARIETTWISGDAGQNARNLLLSG